MARRSIVLSNNDGRVTFSVTGADGTSPIRGVSIEDSVVIGHVSASTIYISGSFRQGNFLNRLTGTLLSSSGTPSFQVFSTSSVTGSAIGVLNGLSGCLGWDGSGYVVTNVMDPQDYGGTVNNGLLSGNYAEDVKVVSIGTSPTTTTVSSGSLKPAFGGTGLTTSNSSFLIKGSGSSPQAFTTLNFTAVASGTIVTSGENKFDLLFPAHKPDVRLYTTASSPAIWTRPIGAKFARLILIGAGGGGGGGSVAATNYGGGGGSSGGYTDITINLFNINSASIQVGSGGSGGASATAGSTGGTTAFTGSNSIIYQSTGGDGGRAGANTTTTGAVGVGLTKNGLGGTSPNGTVPAPTGSISTGGGNGASNGATYELFPGPYVEILSASVINFGYTITTDNVSLTNIKIGPGASGSAVSAATPSKPTFYGAGGGGGYGVSITPAGSGGDGGDGLALIISW